MSCLIDNDMKRLRDKFVLHCVIHSRKYYDSRKLSSQQVSVATITEFGYLKLLRRKLTTNN